MTPNQGEDMRLSIQQRAVIGIGMGLVVILCLYVPWNCVSHGGPGVFRTFSQGYGLIFATQGDGNSMEVDLVRVLIPVCLVICVVVVVVYVLHTPRSESVNRQHELAEKVRFPMPDDRFQVGRKVNTSAEPEYLPDVDIKCERYPWLLVSVTVSSMIVFWLLMFCR